MDFGALLLLFHLYSSLSPSRFVRWKMQWRWRPKETKQKKMGKKKKESFIIGLDVFFNDFIDRVIPPQQQRIWERWPRALKIRHARFTHDRGLRKKERQKSRYSLSPSFSCDVCTSFVSFWLFVFLGKSRSIDQRMCFFSSPRQKFSFLSFPFWTEFIKMMSAFSIFNRRPLFLLPSIVSHWVNC